MVTASYPTAKKTTTSRTSPVSLGHDRLRPKHARVFSATDGWDRLPCMTALEVASQPKLAGL